jgi:hypothetical protein
VRREPENIICACDLKRSPMAISVLLAATASYTSPLLVSQATHPDSLYLRARASTPNAAVTANQLIPAALAGAAVLGGIVFSRSEGQQDRNVGRSPPDANAWVKLGGRANYASNPWGLPYQKTPVRDWPAPPPAPPPAPVQASWEGGVGGRPEYAGNPWGRQKDKTPVRELWVPPAGWVPPSPPQQPVVESWYDAGLRLESEVAPSPLSPRTTVTSWYDSGRRL